MGFELIKVTIALLVVLGGIYLFVRILKQRMLPDDGIIKILHYQAFGQKKGIAVIKVLKEYLVVGVADANISLLSKLNPSDVEETLKQGPVACSPEPGTKKQYLGDKIKDLMRGKFLSFGLFFLLAAGYWLMAPSFAFAAQGYTI